MDQAEKTEIARRSRRLGLIHLAIALGFMIAFMIHTASG